MDTRQKTISGGYRFSLADQPENKLIKLGIPAQIVIPLPDQSESSVQKGSKVRAGQIIARDKKNSSAVYAGASGEVVGFATLEEAGGRVQAAVIRTDNEQTREPLPNHDPNWRQSSPEKLLQLLQQAGLLAPNLSSWENIILNAVADIPYTPSLEVLLDGERLHNLARGLEILQMALPNPRLHIAFNGEKRDLLQALCAEAEIVAKYHPIAPKYPQGNKELLSRTILGEDYDPARTKVFPVQTILAIHSAVVRGYPLTEQIIALGGPGWRENVHLSVPVGTPLRVITESYLRQDGNYRLVPNNILTSPAHTVLDFPVTAELTSLAAIPDQADAKLGQFFTVTGEQGGVNGQIKPCIFCGYCEEVCPAGLMPHLLEKYVKRDLIGPELLDYRIFDCLDCNLCTLVCPSRLPVAGLIRLGQVRLREEGFVEVTKEGKVKMYG